MLQTSNVCDGVQIGNPLSEGRSLDCDCLSHKEVRIARFELTFDTVFDAEREDQTVAGKLSQRSD